LIINNSDILKSLGKKVKRARFLRDYTQEYVAENIGISIDLLRNIENGRNIGSVPTLINLCNILGISMNYLFSDFLNNIDNSFDIALYNYIKDLSDEDRDILKKIIIHIDKNY